MSGVKMESELSISTSDHEHEDEETNREDGDHEGSRKDEENEASCFDSNNPSRFRSCLWRFFTLSKDGHWVQCNKCKRDLRKASNSNLRRHLSGKHPSLYEKLARIEGKDPGREPPTMKPQKEKKPVKVRNDHLEHVNMGLRRSHVWRSFTVLNRNSAKCNFCDKRLGLSSIGNLHRHLKRFHEDAVDYKPIDKEFKEHLPDILISKDENDESIDERSFPDDVEGVKALLGLTGAQVDKTIEIIEQVNEDEEHFNEEYLDDFYNDDNNDSDDELIIKKTAKPALRKCLESVKKTTVQPVEPVVKKREDNIDVLVKNIENKLRMMNLKQQVIAEYKIHEILFLGISNQLKFNNEESNVPHLTYTIEEVNAETVETTTVQ